MGGELPLFAPDGGGEMLDALHSPPHLTPSWEPLNIFVTFWYSRCNLNGQFPQKRKQNKTKVCFRGGWEKRKKTLYPDNAHVGTECCQVKFSKASVPLRKPLACKILGF